MHALGKQTLGNDAPLVPLQLDYRIKVEAEVLKLYIEHHSNARPLIAP